MDHNAHVDTRWLALLADHMSLIAIEATIEAYAARHPDAQMHDAHMYNWKLADHNAHVDTWWFARCAAEEAARRS